MFDAEWARRVRLGAGAGPLIGLRVWIGPEIWRIGPAWAVLAGALASGAALLADTTPLRLVGAILLADSVWGVLWRMTSLPPAAGGERPAETLNLPYYREASPAGRIVRLLHWLTAGAGWPELLASFVLATVLGLLLGPSALLLTVMAWAVALWGWLLMQSGRQPAACDALLNVGAPWLLGLAVAEPATLPALWRTVAGEAALPGELARLSAGVLLGLAFTVQGWGSRRAFLSHGRRSIGLWLGQAAILAVLIGLQQTQALVVVALLLLPPAWLLWQAGDDLRAALARSGAWWLAAMLTAATSLMMR